MEILRVHKKVRRIVCSFLISLTYMVTAKIWSWRMTLFKSTVIELGSWSWWRFAQSFGGYSNNILSSLHVGKRHIRGSTTPVASSHLGAVKENQGRKSVPIVGYVSSIPVRRTWFGIFFFVGRQNICTIILFKRQIWVPLLEPIWKRGTSRDQYNDEKSQC